MNCRGMIVLSFLTFSAAAIAQQSSNLLLACKSNDLAQVQQLISASDVNAANEQGETPLFCAVLVKNIDIVKALLEANASVESKDPHKLPIVEAAKIGNVDILKLLAEHGGDLHQCYLIEQEAAGTLLHIAVTNDDLKTAQYLLSEKVSLETRNSSGYSPLMVAAMNGNMEIVKLLVENGAYLYADPGYGGSLLESEVFRPSLPIKRYLQEIEKQRMEAVIEPAWIACLKQERDKKTIDLQSIEDFISQGKDPSGVDKTGRTLLHYMAEADLKNTDLFEKLTEHAAIDINSADMHGQTALHIACRHDNVSQVKVLLDHGANVNSRDYDENTPLVLLAWFYHSGTVGDKEEIEIAKLLLDKGADVNAANAFGCTALLYVAEDNMNKHLDFTRLLLEQGADVNRQDHEGNTFLHRAADLGKAEMMKLVIEAGADLSIRNYSGRSIAACARYDSPEKIDLIYQYKKDVTFVEAVYYSQGAIVERMVQNGTDINMATNYEHCAPAVVIAARRNDKNMLNRLLSLGANVNNPDKTGCTALHYASQFGHDEIVRCLLDSGADINLRNTEGLRAIDLAAVNNRYRALQLIKDKHPDLAASNQPVLGQNGATKEIKLDPAGKKAAVEMFKQIDPNLIEKMQAEEQRSMAKSLLSETTQPLHIAVIKGQLDKVEQMIAAGANVNEIDEAGMLPITYAVRLENEQMLTLLINKGADINLRDSNLTFHYISSGGHGVGHEAGAAAMHYAAAIGNERMLDILIEKGADLNVPEKEELRSPIFVAVEADKPDILKKLVKAGADLKYTNKNGETLLHSMARRGQVDYIQLLLELGADIETKTRSGETPLMTAAALGEQNAMIFLIERGADLKVLGGNLLCSVIGKPYGHETLRILIEYGIDINTKNSNGEPPLFCLCKSSYDLKDLVANLQLILDAGLDITACDNKGNTILHCAAEEWDENLAELMLANGADVNRANNDGKTPLDLLFRYVTTCKSEKLVHLLAENNTHLNSTDFFGRNVLHNAAIFGWADIVKYLASKGADIENRENDKSEGRTPLHSAVYKKHSDAVKVLLELGADVSTLDKWKATPLHTAAHARQAEIVQLLLDYKSDINAQDQFQNTPLHVAVDSNSPEVVKLLLDRGARTDIRNRGKLTPAELARGRKQPELVALFE